MSRTRTCDIVKAMATPLAPDPSRSPPIVFELCAETLEACIAARDGGAHRIELCRELSVGGLTPDHRLIAAAVAQTQLPVHVLVRPRAGDFCYTVDEFEDILQSVATAKRSGAAGVVLGVLRGVLLIDRTVDIARTRQLVRAARPMQVTFHRAFDETPSLPDALEAVIATGCDRVLTSGGAADVLAGALALRALVQQARDRIDIAAGGGLRLQNAAAVARATGARHFHGSLQQSHHPQQDRAATVREMVRRLQHA